MLGYPDQAVVRSEKAIAIAQANSHAESIAEAMIRRAEIALLRRDIQDARERAVAALAVATEHGMPIWTAIAACMHGWALSEHGQGAEGAAQIREGLSGLARTADQLYRPYYLARLAEALGKTGQVDEALSDLDEAIESSRQFGVPYLDSELQRRKGELLLLANGLDQVAAEACFRAAIDVAQAQSSRSLELRATTSLARLLTDQGKCRQAYDLLLPIYSWFTEGFETADLADAKSLLDRLTGGRLC